MVAALTSSTAALDILAIKPTDDKLSALSAFQDEAREHASLTTTQSRDYRGTVSWMNESYKDMSFYEFIGTLFFHDAAVYRVDTNIRSAPPRHSLLRTHFYVLSNALPPMIFQQAWMWAFPNHPWPWFVALGVYFFSFILQALRNLAFFGHYMKEYGTFDQRNIGRDPVNDVNLADVVTAVLRFFLGRAVFENCFWYNKWEQPINNFSWTFPFRSMLMILLLDYFFYCYHRAAHEVDWLWRIHARHHTTRHPTPALSLLADDFQEVLEIGLIPFAASLLVPFTFHEVYTLHVYLIWVEMFGHTGIRADWETPLIGPVLRLIGMELQTEDHDLHHRYGKSGSNYCKQTRVWDIVFGTCTPREEMANRLTKRY